jgi:phage anti-repressor protein
MDELVPIGKHIIGGEEVHVVDARTLHGRLGSQQEFANWFKQRVSRYGFRQGVDFVVFDSSVRNSREGRPGVDYALTLDMAKELAMVERTEIGRQVRLYFIECEKRLREVVHPLDVAALVRREVAAAVVELVTPTAMAKAEEHRPTRVWQDGITVRELTGLFIRPHHPDLNFRSVSAKLSARLNRHCGARGLTVMIRSGIRFFPRLEAMEMVPVWRVELVNTPRRDSRQLTLLHFPK